MSGLTLNPSSLVVNEIQDLDQSKNDYHPKDLISVDHVGGLQCMAELKKMPSFYQIQLYELYSYSMLLLFKTFLGTLIESNILKMRSNLHEEISINIPNFGKLCNGSDGRWVDRLQGHFAVRLPSSAACPLLFQSAAEHTGPGSIKSWIPRLCDSTQGCQMANFAT